MILADAWKHPGRPRRDLARGPVNRRPDPAPRDARDLLRMRLSGLVGYSRRCFVPISERIIKTRVFFDSDEDDVRREHGVDAHGRLQETARD